MSENRANEDQPGLWEAPEQEPRRSRKRRPRDLAATRSQTEPSIQRQRTMPPLPTKRPTRPMEFKELWDIDDVANYLGVPKQTIYSWRQTSYGPKAFRVGKHLRWRAKTVIAWTLGLEREP